MGWVFGQAQGVWAGMLLWSGWLSSLSSGTPHNFIQIHITYHLLQVILQGPTILIEFIAISFMVIG